MKKFNYISIFICMLFIAILVTTGLAKAAGAQVNEEIKSSEGQKEEYKKKVKGKLTAFEKGIKEIEAKSKKLDARAKADIRKGIKELKEKHKTAQREMKKLDAAGKNTWKTVKIKIDKVMDEFEKAFEKVRSYVKQE